jgi:hypothetical protein
MIWLDQNESVVSWNSEDIVIPYLYPIDNKMHRYFVDMIATFKIGENKFKTVLIEIKPKKQSLIESKASDRDRAIVAVNYAKWDAATKWARRQGLTFRVINEDQIFHQGSKKTGK